MIEEPNCCDVYEDRVEYKRVIDGKWPDPIEQKKCKHKYIKLMRSMWECHNCGMIIGESMASDTEIYSVAEYSMRGSGGLWKRRIDIDNS